MLTHTHEVELLDPVLHVVERSNGQIWHESSPEESLYEPTSQGWHVSVDESSSYPAGQTHTPPTSTNDGPHSHDDELDEPGPEVDMRESLQVVHDPRSDDDL